MVEKVYTKAELDEIGRKFEKALTKWENEQATVGDWESYNHDGGVRVEGFKENQWVYFPQYKKGKKHYDWALWKALNKLEYFKEEKGKK